jgi:eukaryotic-like serine/threonine-protein kinase
VEGRGPFERPGGSAAIMAAVAHEEAPRAPSAGPLGPVIDALLRADPAERPDADTTARMLADAAAQAESGPASPGGIAGSALAFADVREFPPMPPPADLPASADLPEFLDQPGWLELPTAVDEQAPGYIGARSPWPTGSGAQAPGYIGAGPPWPQAAGAPATADAPTAAVPGSRPPAASASAAGPAQPRPRERRGVLAAALTAVAVAAAGLIGWAAYSHLAGTSGGPGSVAAARGNATSTGGNGGPATHGTAGARTAGSSTSDPGTGNASGGPANGGAAPRAGYQWFQVTAASSGTTAGFEIAAPPSWQMTRQGAVSYLRPPSGNASIEINLAPFTYLRPLREASLLQAQAIQQDLYPGYQRIAIRPGILLGAPDAAWRFSWQDGATRTGVLELLVTVDTTAGVQSYQLALSAPSAQFASAEAIFRRALPTFRPLT